MTIDRVARDHLRSFVERIERTDEEIKACNDDKRDIYTEAKANGFDVPALKEVIRYRRKLADDADKLKEREAIFEVYMQALGMRTEEAGTEPATRAPARATPEPKPQSLSAAVTPPDDLTIPACLDRRAANR